MPETKQELDVLCLPTDVAGADEEDDFMLTQRAAEVIKKAKSENDIEENFKLRIGAQSGGCSGMQYAMGFDDKLTDFDKVFSLDDYDFDIVVDRKSLFYVMGVTLDFAEGPGGSGFVFKNPNNMPTCGCSH